MKSANKLYLASLILLLLSTSLSAIEASEVKESIIIDANLNEVFWQKQRWYLIDKPIIGELPSSSDFSGRYKIGWDTQHIYIVAEIIDDVLFDFNPNPLEKYWDDDCLEIFIDEDASGGDHLHNFNAFAYHVALDNQVVDIGAKKSDGSTNVVLLNEHIESRWKRSVEDYRKIIWELAVKVYDDNFSLKPDSNHKPQKLFSGKKMGFMLAYCDNDGSAQREHFVGSHSITPKNGDKNLGYKDASVFGKLILRD
ncbi:MAG: CBM9 family sugar-binding protein [Kangiellaceae bacterium]|nr:CBM9 family sugar-binding protein [Kangiellaceae bacterium]MCW8998505.1 CBM9 family sugar-binding protein [Kangiellaceae bacterium]MCW9017966.1 CBM9 family sugar-binding protein [Kangiellaceae bacterium]